MIVRIFLIVLNTLSHPKKILFKVWNNAHSNEALYDSMEADEEKLTVSNSGHWMSASGWGITVHAAMTNAAKASLLVEVEFNITTTHGTNEQSPVVG